MWSELNASEPSPSMEWSFSEITLLGDSQPVGMILFPWAKSGLLSIPPWVFHHMLPPMGLTYGAFLPYFSSSICSQLLSSSMTGIGLRTSKGFYIKCSHSPRGAGHFNPCFRWENCRPGKFSNLLKATQLVRGREVVRSLAFVSIRRHFKFSEGGG